MAALEGGHSCRHSPPPPGAEAWPMGAWQPPSQTCLPQASLAPRAGGPSLARPGSPAQAAAPSQGEPRQRQPLTQVVPDVHLPTQRAHLDDGLPQEVVGLALQPLLDAGLDVIVLIPDSHFDAVRGVMALAASRTEAQLRSPTRLPTGVWRDARLLPRRAGDSYAHTQAAKQPAATRPSPAHLPRRVKAPSTARDMPRSSPGPPQALQGWALRSGYSRTEILWVDAQNVSQAYVPHSQEGTEDPRTTAPAVRLSPWRWLTRCGAASRRGRLAAEPEGQPRLQTGLLVPGTICPEKSPLARKEPAGATWAASSKPASSSGASLPEAAGSSRKHWAVSGHSVAEGVDP